MMGSAVMVRPDAFGNSSEHPEEILRLGRNGQADIKSRQNWEEVVERNLQVYREVLSGRSKA